MVQLLHLLCVLGVHGINGKVRPWGSLFLGLHSVFRAHPLSNRDGYDEAIHVDVGAWHCVRVLSAFLFGLLQMLVS